MDFPNDVKDLIIIGGGPAGLTAGLYAVRDMLNVVLLEELAPGGQIAKTAVVENYPGFPEPVNGFELVNKVTTQAKNQGLVIDTARVLKLEFEEKSPIKTVITDKDQYRALSVIIATGARYRKLGIPGEKEFHGRGVSYCATCDGMFFRGKDIAAVGGGDTALKESLFLSRFVNKLTLIHRRDRLRGERKLQERLLSQPNVEVMWNSVLNEITGGEAVEELEVKNLVSNESSRIPVKGVFMFVGLIPNTEFLKEQLELTDRGYIVTDQAMGTSQNGVFAVGDARHKLLRQMVTACGEGATAAHAARLYVERLKGESYT
ncbi:MAG: thioredoxin-disulfide reductase [bacterium]|nr:thioredoxin-disulfide reductase [bacterium]